MTIRPQPCAYCPYRADVPSGVWHEEEYRKLAAYDAATYAQPRAPFMCHEKSGCICSGWAQVHENRPGCELLALRLAEIRHGRIVLPAATVPLFASGTEAATHGMRDIDTPSANALRAQDYITKLQTLITAH